VKARMLWSLRWALRLTGYLLAVLAFLLLLPD
jgi:hypothetical protein